MYGRKRSDCAFGSWADPLGSMSSMEVNVDLLEQMDLTDVSDHEALDVFLSSVGEESSAASPDAGLASPLTKLLFTFNFHVHSGAFAVCFFLLLTTQSSNAG